MLAFFIFIVGVVSRLIVHLPNFTPVVALAFFGGCYLKKRQAIFLPVALLAVTDFFIGFHHTMPFTWVSVMLVAAFGTWVRERKSWKTVLGGSLLSAFLFFVVTNWGVWLVGGLYPPTMEGLRRCFLMAIPFFRYTLASTVMYTVAFFVLYERIAGYISRTKYAGALL